MELTIGELNELVEKCAARVLAESILDRFRRGTNNNGNTVVSGGNVVPSLKNGFCHIPALDDYFINSYNNQNSNTQVQNTQQRSRGGFQPTYRSVGELIDYFEKRGDRMIGRYNNSLVMHALQKFYKDLNYDNTQIQSQTQNQ